MTPRELRRTARKMEWHYANWPYMWASVAVVWGMVWLLWSNPVIPAIALFVAAPLTGLVLLMFIFALASRFPWLGLAVISGVGLAVYWSLK